MKSFFKLFLAPILILGFLSFVSLDTDVKSNKNLNKDNINYQNNEINNYSEYSENSISSQQFIDELESVPEGGTYELLFNVDFSDSENDDVTGLELNGITIEGNGYTLYNRDVTEIFNTSTFEVTNENNGLGYYSFFEEIDSCNIFNLNFDNFMFPFGEIRDSSLVNVNFYNLNYENLIFNVFSSNVTDWDDYGAEIINIAIATIGLIAQNIFNTNFKNCVFENINFSNNEIILFDEDVSTIIAPIGNFEAYTYTHNYFENIYINNINFSNNQYVSGFNNNLFIGDEEQEKYFSIFYSPFIGSATNDFVVDINTSNIMELNEVIFNNINVSGNSNDFANYTFYSLLPPISSGVDFYGENIYGFNLNLDIQNQLDNNENIGVGNLSYKTFYSPDDFHYTGIYQTDWINDVYYQNIALNYTSYLNDESMIEGIHNNNGDTLNELTDFWYFDKLSIDQDYSLVLVDKPTIIYEKDSFYDQNEEIIDIYFRLLDGRYGDRSIYYSNYTVNLINKYNSKIIWSGYAGDLSLESEGEFKASIDLELLFENNLYFEISNYYHTWEQDIDFRKHLPEVYNVTNIIENNNLVVSYDFFDPYNLINSINISLYDNLNNQIENKTIDYNNSETDHYLNSEQIIFDTKIDDPNNYYLTFEVNCNNFDYYRSYDSPFYIDTLDNNLIQYNQINDVEFVDPLITPDIHKSISWKIILLIVVFALILISLFIFLIYRFQIKSKK